MKGERSVIFFIVIHLLSYLLSHFPSNSKYLKIATIGAASKTETMFPPNCHSSILLAYPIPSNHWNFAFVDASSFLRSIPFEEKKACGHPTLDIPYIRMCVIVTHFARCPLRKCTLLLCCSAPATATVFHIFLHKLQNVVSIFGPKIMLNEKKDREGRATATAQWQWQTTNR